MSQFYCIDRRSESEKLENRLLGIGFGLINIAKIAFWCNLCNFSTWKTIFWDVLNICVHLPSN